MKAVILAGIVCVYLYVVVELTGLVGEWLFYFINIIFILSIILAMRNIRQRHVVEQLLFSSGLVALLYTLYVDFVPGIILTFVIMFSHFLYCVTLYAFKDPEEEIVSPKEEKAKRWLMKNLLWIGLILSITGAVLFYYLNSILLLAFGIITLYWGIRGEIEKRKTLMGG
ncbi:hypothetical protein [Jeotgalibacillus sp. R-1-5s-1]|uniref:hypothetical protein n=1 Tax=Jeotgalibacillus sp. R-1-5s-1 TaxID=2555897 RepID=UPI0010696AFC|nr:hypothetical protein [Jeotgalibacillus sp. R-1-5s-1]TFD99905.1 hypothetical protein E2491_05520 [Jeotgalibacillus sp. R-1-5s-1]